MTTLTYTISIVIYLAKTPRDFGPRCFLQVNNQRYSGQEFYNFRMNLSDTLLSCRRTYQLKIPPICVIRFSN